MALRCPLHFSVHSSSQKYPQCNGNGLQICTIRAPIPILRGSNHTLRGLVTCMAQKIYTPGATRATRAAISKANADRQTFNPLLPGALGGAEKVVPASAASRLWNYGDHTLQLWPHVFQPNHTACKSLPLTYLGGPWHAPC